MGPTLAGLQKFRLLSRIDEHNTSKSIVFIRIRFIGQVCAHMQRISDSGLA